MTSLAEILHNIGYTKLKDYGKQYSTKPLYRDSDNETALTINKETGEWYDFVERIGGPIETLIEKTLGTELTPEMKERIASEEFLPQRREEVEMPHQKTFPKDRLAALEKDHSYWVNRGVSLTTMNKFNGGVTRNGKMRNRYVFPIFDERGNLIGMSGRYIYKSDYVIKWKHLGQKSNWVYPLIHIPEIMKEKKVILVESIGDMLALHDAGIHIALVTFGVKLSSGMIKALLKLDVNRIFIGLNNDRRKKSVGNKAAVEFRYSLQNYFDAHQIQIALPSEKNDFGDMTREEITLWKTENLI